MDKIFVHETAIVDDGASVGLGSYIWHWVHICGKAQIGSNVTLGQNVYIGNDVKIGNNCKIQNNVSVYDGVTLEDGVFCGPSMVFTNVINPRSLIDRKHEFKKTTVKKGVTLGANCTIVCGVTIGKYGFVAAGSVITKDVEPYSLMIGVPARHAGWISEYGEKLDLPLYGSKTTTCKLSGTNYILNGNSLKRID